MKFVAPVFFACLLAPVLVRGDGLVADRDTLSGILGASAYTETFEAYSVAATTAVGTTTTVLNSSTVANGQGPGLVGGGASYAGENASNGEYTQWDGANYYGAPSTELLFGNTGTNTNTLDINFGAPTQAFGLDVRDFTGWSASLTVSVYAMNGTLLYTTPEPISLINGTPLFFGYQSTTGIGSVRLTDSSTIDTWTPIIDNVEFTPVPEPSTIALFIVGLGLVSAYAARQRSARLNTAA